MNAIQFETMRAKANVDECQKQFDAAVDFCLRMADELKQARERGWNMTCPSNNLANSAIEVGRIAARLETLLDTHSTLKRIDG
jgi:hypothetical protein